MYMYAIVTRKRATKPSLELPVVLVRHVVTPKTRTDIDGCCDSKNSKVLTSQARDRGSLWARATTEASVYQVVRRAINVQ